MIIERQRLLASKLCFILCVKKLHDRKRSFVKGREVYGGGSKFAVSENMTVSDKRSQTKG